jgi:hypothetical protein
MMMTAALVGHEQDIRLNHALRREHHVRRGPEDLTERVGADELPETYAQVPRNDLMPNVGHRRYEKISFDELPPIAFGEKKIVPVGEPKPCVLHRSTSRSQ